MAKTTKEFIKSGLDTEKLNQERQKSDPPLPTPPQSAVSGGFDPSNVENRPDNPAVYDAATMGLRPV